jgi:hypothetical protein
MMIVIINTYKSSTLVNKIIDDYWIKVSINLLMPKHYSSISIIFSTSLPEQSLYV